MVNNNSNEFTEKLSKLSERERQVLMLRCEGSDYKSIGGKLFVTVSAVKQYMSRVYVKLELDLLPRAERMKALYEIYCPLLKKIEAEPVIVEAETKEVVTGEPVSEGLEPISPDMDKMLDEDEYPLATFKPTPKAPLVIQRPIRGPTPPPIRPIWLMVLILGVVLGICVGAGGVYLFLKPGNGPNPFIPQPTSTISSPAPLDTATAIAAPLPAPIDTATIVPAPTNTSVPTLTEVATTVPPPTNIPFVPPADGILFQDNFDNGLKSDWIQYSGQWIVSDGKLTEVYQSSSTDAYSWIGVENPSWKNYIVDLTIQIYQPLTESDEIALAVRDNNVGAKYIGFEIDFWPHIYLSLISQGYSSSAPLAGNNKDFTFPLKADAQTEIKVENNNYTLAVNGTTLQTISIPGYDSGGFRLGLLCRGYPRCPTFDNFKVTYLP